MAKRISTNPTLPQIKPAALRRFHVQLADWYKTHGRHSLPWRQTEDAYPIWISEVMLQQTQVATVLARFYHPFLKTFPTIEALAAAPQEKVMKAWEGLGYYSRARNLHKAAQAVADAAKATRKNKAQLPDSYEALLALPGIGRNTAQAILAFAYHQPVAILEANVKRVVARIFALKTPSDTQLWDGAEMLLNEATPFDYNQAMMDLGSMICTPRKPSCMICPANTICEGKSEPERYPAPKIRKVVPVRKRIITVMEDRQGRFYLAPRGDKLLGGLYGFPQNEPGTKPEGVYLGDVIQVYSHFRLEAEVWLEHTAPAASEKHWHSRAEIDALPLSGIDHKVLALIDISHTARKKPSKSKTRRATR